jgi:hypothetical protein
MTPSGIEPATYRHVAQCIGSLCEPAKRIHTCTGHCTYFKQYEQLASTIEQSETANRDMYINFFKFTSECMNILFPLFRQWYVHPRTGSSSSSSSSSCSLPIAPSKASSPHSAILCFLFQFPLSFRFLDVIQYLHTSSSSSSHNFYPSLYLSFNNVFQKAVPTQIWPIQLAFLHFIASRIFLSLTLRNTSSFSTYYWPNYDLHRHAVYIRHESIV